jgi:hypothetical protein
MAKKNDTRILELKRQIDAKKAALKRVEKFVPITNCSLQLINNGVRFNLHALNLESLTEMLVHLNTYRMSSADLGINMRICGYALQDWIDDIKSKMLVLDRQGEESRLKALEAKLTDLLSAEKKTELLIEEISGTL